MSSKVAIGELYSFINKKNGLKYVGNLVKIDAQTKTITLGNVFHLGSEGRLGGGIHEIAPDLYEQPFMVTPSEEIFFFIREDPAFIEAIKNKYSDPNVGLGRNQNIFEVAQQEQAPHYDSKPKNSGFNHQVPSIPQPSSVPVQKQQEPKVLSAPTFVDPSAPSEQVNTKQQQHAPQKFNQHRNNQYNNNHYNNYKGGNRTRNNELVMPKKDFDFESFNAQFNKSEVQKEIQAENEQNFSNLEHKDYYDKKSSFFDNISCDAKDKLDRKDRRNIIQQERQTNQETFGETFVQRNHNGNYNYRGGYRGRGRGYYNNYRGGRGRGNSNYQNHSNSY